MKMKTKKKIMKARPFNGLVASLLALLIVLGSFGPVFAEDQSIISDPVDDLIISAEQTTFAGDLNYRYVDVNVQLRDKDTISEFENVFATAKIANPQTVTIEGSGLYPINQDNLNNKKSDSFRIDVSTLDTEKDVTVPIEITVTYDIVKKIYDRNPNNGEFKIDAQGNKTIKYLGTETRQQTTTIYVIHRAEKLPANSALEISKVDIVPNGYVIPGSNFSLIFNVKNTGDAEARNIKASLEGMEPAGINIASGLATKDITILKAGEETSLVYDMKIPASAKAGMYPLTLKYDFIGTNSKGQETTSPTTGSYAFSVDVNQADRDPSALIFEKINFPSGRLGKNKIVPISFTLKNIGTENAQNVKISAISQDVTGLTPVSSSTAIVEKILPGQSANYKFDFKTTDTVSSKAYPVEIKVEYTDKSVADKPHEISQIVGVNGVDWEAEAQKNKDLPTSTPILIIEKYNFDPELIYAGTQFKMDLVFRNTSDKTIKNIKIALSSDAAQSSDQSKLSTQASVFTPVQSSNTFFIESIPAGGKVDKQITLTTSHDTAANTYTLTADVTYEDSQAKQYNSKEIIGVTVVQDSKFSLGEIVLDPEYYVGMPGNISVDFYNTGKVTLSNFMVEFESDGDISSDMPTYYKGNFPSGTTDNYTASITVNSPEAKKGKLVFSYEDTTGQSHSLEKEFELNVQEMIMPEENFEDMPMPEEPASKTPKIIAGLVGLGLIGAAIVIYKKRKKKKEEEDLMIDED
ncbi:MAG: NEW3 domain-containing protein [Bacillota bacterium]|nr:NEW3 domain-containing protein [Bacillota bacterium]